MAAIFLDQWQLSVQANMLVEVLHEMQPLPKLPGEKEGVPLLLSLLGQLASVACKQGGSGGSATAAASFASLAKLLTQQSHSGGVLRLPMLRTAQLVKHLLGPWLLKSSPVSHHEQTLAIAGLRAVLLDTPSQLLPANSESRLYGCFQQGLLTPVLRRLATNAAADRDLRDSATDLAEDMVAALAAAVDSRQSELTAAAASILEATQGMQAAAEAVLLPLLSACTVAAGGKRTAVHVNRVPASSSQVKSPTRQLLRPECIPLQLPNLCLSLLFLGLPLGPCLQSVSCGWIAELSHSACRWSCCNPC